MTNHICLVGTTASGKSRIAIEIAKAFPDTFELVSADSMAVYRGMDIGTATPTAHERQAARHHMIDIVDAGADYTLSEFQSTVRAVMKDIESRNKRAILVGGTGLYVRAIVDPFDIPGQFPDARRHVDQLSVDQLTERLGELDPLALSRIPKGNERRLQRALEVTIGSGRPFSSFDQGMDRFAPTSFAQFGIWLPRPVVAKRIESRVDEMISSGWIDETRKLLDGDWSRTARQAIGYKQWQQVIAGEVPLESARTEVISATKSFARKQRMWFRRDPRVKWFGTEEDPAALIPALLAECRAWRNIEMQGGDK